MGNFKFFGLISILFAGIVFVSSCESEEALASYQNPNQSDTSGNNIQVDLFVNALIDNIPVNYANGIHDYSNWSISEKEGFCMTDPNHFIQSHVTAYIVPNKLVEAIYIDIRGCVNNDSLSDTNSIDSVLVVGPYTYYPKMKHNRTAIVKYIDADSVLWSTAFGGNESSFSRFELSAIISNDFDDYSEKIGFGKFEGYFYNGKGDSLKIKSGQFKGRIVQ
ncbi:MAG: hypothetical protein ACI85Q_000709 [Salibacteraceae bacterium]|jgi:hypothetical protein